MKRPRCPRRRRGRLASRPGNATATAIARAVVPAAAPSLHVTQKRGHETMPAMHLDLSDDGRSVTLTVEIR